MSRLRVPVVAGRTAGVGTSTLAAALHAVDGGRWAGGPVDVLVCSADDDLAALPPVPVLVLRGGAAAVPAPSRGGAVVVLPEVAAWAGADATRAAAGLLGLGPAHRPAALHGYAEALLAVTAALVRSGVLAREPGGPARRRPDGRAAAAPSAPAHRPGHPPEPLARPADAATSAHPARAAGAGARRRRVVVVTGGVAAGGVPVRDGPVGDAPTGGAPGPDTPAGGAPTHGAPAGQALGAPTHGALPVGVRTGRVRTGGARPRSSGPVPPRTPLAPDGPGRDPRRPTPAVPGPVADGPPRPVPHQPVAHRPVPVVPVLLHRAEPVRPRLVAGREFRLAGDPPARPPAPRRLRLAPVPDGPAAADTGGADDEAIEDLDRPPTRRVRRRTG